MRLSGCVLPLAAALAVGVSWSGAADSRIKFPEPGSTIPGSFSPLIISNVTMKDKTGKPVLDMDGKPVLDHRQRSPVAQFGLKPVVLVFARDYKDEAVLDFVKKLEARVAAHQAQDLCGSAIFLCHDDKRQEPDLKPEELIAVANDQENVIANLQKSLPGVKNVLVGIDAPAGPKGYHVEERAYVTVILYQKFQVYKSFVYGIGDGDNKEGSFDKSARDSILKAIDQWMASLKRKAGKAGK